MVKYCEILSTLLNVMNETHEGPGRPQFPWLYSLFFLQVPIPGLVEGSAKRKRILSPEELEDRRKKRQEAVAKRKRLLEEKRKKKEEAEHKKKYVCVI